MTLYQIRTVLGEIARIIQQLARHQPVVNALAMLEGRLCQQATHVEEKAILQKVSSLVISMFTCQRNHNDDSGSHHPCSLLFTQTFIHPQGSMVSSDGVGPITHL